MYNNINIPHPHFKENTKTIYFAAGRGQKLLMMDSGTRKWIFDYPKSAEKSVEGKLKKALFVTFLPYLMIFQNLTSASYNFKNHQI